MEARQLKQREYFTDIFNARSTTSAQSSRPIHQNPNAAPTVRASYQDSNIFGYKQNENQTWQEPGRQDRGRTELKQNYQQARHSAGMTLSNPESPMKHHKTVTHQTHIAPETEHYKINSKPYEPLH